MAALVLALALERPTAGRQLVLLASLPARVPRARQAIVLLPAVATAPLLLAWLDRRSLRRAVGEFRLL